MRWSGVLLLGLLLAGCLAQPPRSTAPAELDSCAVPVHGLDHPCLADGLQVGEAVFWNGSALQQASDPVGAVDGDPLGVSEECGEMVGDPEYVFAVGETGDGVSLQVDVQVFIRDLNYIRPQADIGLEGSTETWLIARLHGPDGTCIDEGRTHGNFGVRLATPENGPAPALGTWTVRVQGLLPQPLEYRMRAHLAPPPADPTPMLPDLRIIAPFEIGFSLPTATTGPGATSPDATPSSGCMPEEHLEAAQNGMPQPRRCLRFSMGLTNAGEGPFRLRAPSGWDGPLTLLYDPMTGLGLESLPLVQTVCSPTNSNCVDLEPVAGLAARFHHTHAHFHYQNAYVYDLYRITEDDGSPVLQFVGTSGKLGLDPTNEAWEGWGRFYQRSHIGEVAIDGDGAEVPFVTQAIQAGWGDVYDWNRGGNYIDFPLDGLLRPIAGDYVIRGTTDALEQVRESDETNNVAYAHFTVTDAGGVHLHERGYGMDPWDPAKVPADVAP